MPDPHLLLVDDAPEVRTLVTLLGKRAGYRVDACASVAAAWEFVQKTRPGLILLDVQMPPVSGVELCKRVRAAGEPLRTTPVALFTHWGVPDDVAAGLEAGADYVVCKDLLSDPARWQGRVGEIFAHAASPASIALLTYAHGAVDTSLAPPPNWVDVINAGLHRIMVRRLGGDVARIIVRRAVAQARDARPEALAFGGDEGFPVDWAALAARPEAAVVLAAALADQTDCLLGTEEGAGLRAALAPLLVRPEAPRSPR